MDTDTFSAVACRARNAAGPAVREHHERLAREHLEFAKSRLRALLTPAQATVLSRLRELGHQAGAMFEQASLWPHFAPGRPGAVAATLDSLFHRRVLDRLGKGRGKQYAVLPGSYELLTEWEKAFGPAAGAGGQAKADAADAA